MNEWKEAQDEYNATEIPQELDARVQSGIYLGKERRKKMNIRNSLFRIPATVAAGLAALFIALNVSPTFAAAAGDLPVVGGFLRVMSVDSWHEKDEDRTLDVNVPAITNGNDYTKKINAEIQERVKQKAEEGNQAVQDYKKAFFETGGTQADWDKHDNRVTVTYFVKSQTATIVSFVIDSSVSTTSAQQEQFFYNLDMVKDRELTLKDLLGSDWINVCNQGVRKQIADYPLATGDTSPFFGADMGGFNSVDSKTNFYINTKGNPVLVFPKYSIAIGAMGPIEFEITK